MIESGLLVNCGFYGPDYWPGIEVQTDNEIVKNQLALDSMTLQFDMSQRYCCGWYDLEQSQPYPCPDSTKMTDPKYSQCIPCRQKTGFNPAFYMSTDISPQQAKRNAQPHALYLAGFAPGVVKVGINHARRGLRRLLEQGARQAIILKTYPTANDARKAEAQIARIDGMRETMQSRVKAKLLAQDFNSDDLQRSLIEAAQKSAKATVNKFDNLNVINLNKYYFPGIPQLQPSALIDLKKADYISGQIIGMVGGQLITVDGDNQFTINISKRAGYRFTISESVKPNDFAPQQAQMF